MPSSMWWSSGRSKRWLEGAGARPAMRSLHGIATLPRALPGFPWQDETALIRNTITKVVGNHFG